MDVREEKKVTPYFKSYSTSQNTPMGALHTVYDLYHNSKSKVSLCEKCELGLKEFRVFFSPLDMGIDEKRDIC